MEAIVLAGGFGTRLQSVINDVPKPMAPVNGKPFLEYILHYLKHNGIRRVILSVGYKWEIIEEYFGDSFEDMKLVYSVEDKPLGTGGAIKKALDIVDSKNIFIINGDTFFDIKLNSLSLKNNSKIVLSLKKMQEFDRYGAVEIDSNGYVTAFREKEYRKVGNINGGVYCVSFDIFDNFSLNEVFSFEDFMQNNFKSLHVTAKVFDEYFIDIGIPEDYAKAQVELKSFYE